MVKEVKETWFEVKKVPVGDEEVYLNTPLVKILYQIYKELREIKEVLKNIKVNETEQQKQKKK